MRTAARRKLQVFVSSTYRDLVRERLTAIEDYLGVGHIPAAMEQFNPGDETAQTRFCAGLTTRMVTC